MQPPSFTFGSNPACSSFPTTSPSQSMIDYPSTPALSPNPPTSFSCSSASTAKSGTNFMIMTQFNADMDEVTKEVEREREMGGGSEGSECAGTGEDGGAFRYGMDEEEDEDIELHRRVSKFTNHCTAQLHPACCSKQKLIREYMLHPRNENVLALPLHPASPSPFPRRRPPLSRRDTASTTYSLPLRKAAVLKGSGLRSVLEGTMGTERWMPLTRDHRIWRSSRVLVSLSEGEGMAQAALLRV